MTQYAYNPAVYTAAMLELTALSSANNAVLEGPTLAQTMVGACVSAELLAAQAGVVPFIVLPDGTRGVVNVGSARSRIDDPSKWSTPPAANVNVEGVQTLYLAAHGAVRQTDASATKAGDAPLTIDVHAPAVHADGSIGFIPVAVYLVVLGVAAIAATAWYASTVSVERVDVDGENVRALARIDAAVKMGSVSLATTGQVDPNIWDFLKSEATAEQKASSFPWPTIALGGALAAGVAYETHRRGWWQL